MDLSNIFTKFANAITAFLQLFTGYLSYMSGIYIHIPFCATRCIYCDFYSTTLRGKGEAYIAALAQEMNGRKGFLKGHEGTHGKWICDDPLQTIYLGGGTPSQLGDVCIRQLLETISRYFDMSQVIEITMEANPDDIKDGQDWGLVNRVSMGVQSMVDEELTLLHRRHNAQQVRIAVETLRKTGIENISLDLMYGLPQQAMESWEYSIDELLKLKPQHISAYNLSVEEGTKLYNLVEKGELTPCDDETCVEMAVLLRQKLHAAGFEQYEISNYALPGFYSRHNSSYWVQTPYLGLGPGAHSYDGENIRSWNQPRVMDYLNGKRHEEQEILTDTDLYNERIMLGLRTAKGARLTAKEMETKKQAIENLGNRGLINSTENTIVLTEAGLALGDEVIRDLMELRPESPE